MGCPLRNPSFKFAPCAEGQKYVSSQLDYTFAYYRVMDKSHLDIMPPKRSRAPRKATFDVNVCAKSVKLDSETAKALTDNKLNTVHLLGALHDSDLLALGLPLAKVITLRKALTSLQGQGTGGAEHGVKDSAGKENGSDNCQPPAKMATFTNPHLNCTQLLEEVLPSQSPPELALGQQMETIMNAALDLDNRFDPFDLSPPPSRPTVLQSDYVP